MVGPELPPHWKVHPVISIAHLEPYRADVFNRPRPSHPDAVYVEGDTDEYRSYVIEKLIDKSVQIICRKPQIKYLVGWLGYGPEYDMWYPIENLQNAQELIEEYEQLHNARKNRIEQPAKALKCRGRPPKKVMKAVAKFAGIFKRKAS